MLQIAAAFGRFFHGENMADEEEIRRTEYGTREAFLTDIRIARDLKQLKDKSRFWEALGKRVEDDGEKDARIAELEARIDALEKIVETGMKKGAGNDV